MAGESRIIVVEPQRRRRRELKAELGTGCAVFPSLERSRAALESSSAPIRLVVSLPPKSRVKAAGSSGDPRSKTLDFLSWAKPIVSERILDGRGCDTEFYSASRALGVAVWPESIVEEATAWYPYGLEFDIELKDRLAKDIARTELAQELELTPSETSLVFEELCAGGSYEEMGRSLSISLHTVKAHFRNMRVNTGLTRGQLRVRALKTLLFARGLVERE